MYSTCKGKDLQALKDKVEQVVERRHETVEANRTRTLERPRSVFHVLGFSDLYLDAHGTVEKDPRSGEDIIKLPLSESEFAAISTNSTVDTTKATAKQLRGKPAPKQPKEGNPKKGAQAQMLEMMAAMTANLQRMGAASSGSAAPPPPGA